MSTTLPPIARSATLPMAPPSTSAVAMPAGSAPLHIATATATVRNPTTLSSNNGGIESPTPNAIPSL